MDSSDSSNASTSSPVSTPTSPATTTEEIHVLPLDVKYVNSRYVEENSAWEYEDTSNPEVPAELVQPVGTRATSDDNDWEKYCFVVVRKHTRDDEKRRSTISIELVVKSQYLRTALETVMTDARGISWASEPLELDPKLIITYFPKLEEYDKELVERTRTEEEDRILASLRVLLEYMRRNYRQTLARIASLVSHGEITFDLLYAILVPGTVIVRRCPITRETRAVRLRSATKSVNSCGQWFYSLRCEGLEEMVKGDDDDDDDEIGWSDEGTKVKRFGWGHNQAMVAEFSGVEKIHRLSAFPLQFHPDPTALCAMLVARARKWVALSGVHHVQYRGTGSRWEWVNGNQKLQRYSVKSRIMIDAASFGRVDADYELPYSEQSLTDCGTAEDLDEDKLILASPIVYGFSFADKVWLEFNVNNVAPVEWNDEAFAGLVLPEERKNLLRSLIEAHGRLNANFDDFVRGKGQGLVINLFGPPGVGKTLSAEATSEHLRRPLYIVGSGDLGTSAHELDEKLGEAFDLAGCWNAVLLIDEADVFLEQRSLHDMERNAMVAVFLRHIEYYRGILFLTTNRIKTFDEAFLSRIHVALHFTELSAPTKAQIWRAFLRKTGLEEREISDAMVEKLARREINGRQIKNACRTATSLALSRDEKLGYAHLEEALDAMETFLKDFATIQNFA
ncbi:P-loop containing nucleoside triphosphate hydrolase protein [Daedaleopsis nitida]|nr:P-loop containing nucleoside triphosphate hydrolase protein [Daedaleopsis nitida]